MKKRALISVYYKEGVLKLSSFLNESGWEILSTGGTAKYLKENKIPVTDVSSVTGFPECLDGRVKTLHPAIHAGLLARRDDPSHMETLEKLNLGTIDLVCVNLYPFFEEKTIEFIDIGGPTMLRSAAKNFKDVIVLTDQNDYDEVITAIKAGEVCFELRKKLAGKVFSLTSAYDAAVASYLLELENKNAEYPSYLPLSFKKAQNLRYGENNHQSAALYLHTNVKGALADMEQLHGKELGYNNIRDLDLAWKAANFYADSVKTEAEHLVPGYKSEKSICCVAVKHNTPCGFALGNTLLEAYEKTFACDPVSIYGGIVACSGSVDAITAEKMGSIFLEIIIAPDFENDALEILKKKKNLRLMKAKSAPSDKKEYIAVDGGLLVQDTDKKFLEKWEVVTNVSPTKEDIPDLLFGLGAVTFVKSNAILVVKELAASGIGGGQVNRIWSATEALKRSEAAVKAGPWQNTKPARVLASDAFIPFPDVIEVAAAAGIKAIIQPGGSINDKAAIEACNKFGIAMVFTGTRHFKH